jgi:dynein heavy chain, axonemal
VVVDGLAKVVYNSLDFLFEQIDPASIAKDDKMPLIEVKLDLVSVRIGDEERRDEVRFLPDLQEAGGKGVRDLVNSWVGSFFNVATLFKRLDNEGTYLREIHSDHSVKMLLAIINETLEKNEEACNSVKTKYDQFSYLWLTDLTEHFETFLADAQITSPNGQQLLDLEKFSAAICKYEAIRDQLNQFQSPMDVGWLRINTQPIKSQLMTWTSKWIDLFMKHLKKTINEKLTSLDKFMTAVSVGLDVEVDPDRVKGKDSLMRVMEDIRDVRKAIDTTQEIFKPLQESLNILKAHGTDLVLLEKINGKLVQDYLDEAPLAWDSVVKKTFRKKEEILPMQLGEMENLKLDLETFFLSVREFRNKFRADAPFTFTGDPLLAYADLDKHANELMAKEKEAKRFNELEELFELQVSKYAEMGDTRLELRLLKAVWDIKAQIKFVYTSWNGQLWNDIKTDDLEDVNKILLKNLRKMGTDTPVVKGWVVYRSIEEMIKNMSIVLPLINELHSPAMRDRHWKSLAKVCGVKAIDPNDPKFTFEDTVALNVHEHTEDVEEIVETANKELKIERKLRDIDTIWRDMTLEYVPHNDTEMFLVKLSEEVRFIFVLHNCSCAIY